MKKETVPTYTFDIYIAGDKATAQDVCREFCFHEGQCVHVDATTFIYTGGEEQGVRVGLINYPRFPANYETLLDTARRLGNALMARMYQTSYTIVGNRETLWFSRRKTDL